MKHELVLGNGRSVPCEDPASVWVGTPRAIGSQSTLSLSRVREMIADPHKTIRVSLASSKGALYRVVIEVHDEA
jgi:hypothetical protein